MSEKKQQFEITPELISKLNKIYNHFGGRPNKLEKLFEECGEYRDRYILNQMSIKLEPKIVTEICDTGNCFLQMLYNEPLIQEGLIKVIDKAIKKIEEGYYE